MILTNETILRGYLAHLQSLARQAAALRGSAEIHPDNTPEATERRRPAPEMLAMWESLRTDLAKVLDLHLVSYQELALVAFPTGDVDPAIGGRDVTRITFKELKRRADKARRKDPTIMLLKSWKLEEHEVEDDD